MTVAKNKAKKKGRDEKTAKKGGKGTEENAAKKGGKGTEKKEKAKKGGKGQKAKKAKKGGKAKGKGKLKGPVTKAWEGPPPMRMRRAAKEASAASGSSGAASAASASLGLQPKAAPLGDRLRAMKAAAKNPLEAAAPVSPTLQEFYLEQAAAAATEPAIAVPDSPAPEENAPKRTRRRKGKETKDTKKSLTDYGDAD